MVEYKFQLFDTYTVALNWAALDGAVGPAYLLQLPSCPPAPPYSSCQAGQEPSSLWLLSGLTRLTNMNIIAGFVPQIPHRYLNTGKYNLTFFKFLLESASRKDFDIDDHPGTNPTILFHPLVLFACKGQLVC
jgi:hypothetical protein